MRPIFAAAVVFSTAAMAGAPAGWLHGTQERPDVAAAVVPALAAGESSSRARARCATCGIVETIRRIEAAGELAAGYEFTVRLRDGSTRVSSDASQAKWRIGDSIMLIGGAKPPA